MPGRKANHRPHHRQPAAVGQFLHEHPAPEQFLADRVDQHACRHGRAGGRVDVADTGHQLDADGRRPAVSSRVAIRGPAPGRQAPARIHGHAGHVHGTVGGSNTKTAVRAVRLDLVWDLRDNMDAKWAIVNVKGRSLQRFSAGKSGQPGKRFNAASRQERASRRADGQAGWTSRRWTHGSGSR